MKIVSIIITVALIAVPMFSLIYAIFVEDQRLEENS